MKTIGLLLLLAFAVPSRAELTAHEELVHCLANGAVGNLIGFAAGYLTARTHMDYHFPKLALGIRLGLPVLAGLVKELDDQASGGKFDWLQFGSTALGGRLALQYDFHFH